MSSPQANCSSVDPQIEAVLIDLDDTVYAQQRWLTQAWRRVAAVAEAAYGTSADALASALEEIAGEGSDRGRIIDRALERVGARSVKVEVLLEAFRTFEAPAVEPYRGVRDGLTRLRPRARTAVVTDGDPVVQMSKLRSLRISPLVDAVVISDEFGRERRKPDPHALLVAAQRLRVPPRRCVFIGDRPDKDVAAADAAGMWSVRVRTGEYADAPDVPPPSVSVDDLPSAFRAITSWLRSDV